MSPSTLLRLFGIFAALVIQSAAAPQETGRVAWKKGYDPEKEQRGGIGKLPDSARGDKLPPEDSFTNISSTALPDGLKAEMWGPEDDGLRAAAMLPEVLQDGAPERARFFIRNVSPKPIHLTVSESPGFDYATVTDASGRVLDARHNTVWRSVVVSSLSAETNPGETPGDPPTARLKKIRLQPNAVYELEIAGRLAWSMPQPGANAVKTQTPVVRAAPDRDTTTFLTTLPGEVSVTWHLHTTNGSEWAKDLKTRTWPAKGGWTGVLHTAPQKVQLRDRESPRAYPAGTAPAGWSDYDRTTQVSTPHRCVWGPESGGWHAGLALPDGDGAEILVLVRNASDEERTLTVRVTPDRRVALGKFDAVAGDGSPLVATMPPASDGLVEKSAHIPPKHMLMLRGPKIFYGDTAPPDAIRLASGARPVFFCVTLDNQVVKGLTLRTGSVRLGPQSEAEKLQKLPPLVAESWKPVAHKTGTPGCAEFVAHCARVAVESGAPGGDPDALIKWGPPNGTVRTGIVMAPYAPVGCPREAWFVMRDDYPMPSGGHQGLRAFATLGATDPAGVLTPDSYGYAGLPERLWAEYLRVKPGEQVEMPLPWIVFGFQSGAGTTRVATLRAGKGKCQVRARIDSNPTGDITVEVDEDDRRPVDSLPTLLTERPAPSHCAFDPGILTPRGRALIESLVPGGTVADWRRRFQQDGGLSTLWEERLHFEDAGVAEKVVMFSAIVRPTEMPAATFADPVRRSAWYVDHPRWDKAGAVVVAITVPRIDSRHSD